MMKKRLINLLSTDGSLQQKTIKSGFWSFASRFSTRGLDLIKLVIIARLLSPNDFGLLGIALLTLSIFRVFTQTGFKESIIQNKNDVKEHLNTAWTTLILRGILLYSIVFLSAPIVSMFFAETRAELILQVIGLTLVLEGFQNIAIVMLRKDLEFQKRFILDLGRALPNFILTVTLAFILQNVWALVYGTLIGGVGVLFISYLVHPYRPKLEFNKEKAKEMFTFGKFIMAQSVVLFFITQGDDLLVVRVLGATALGFYVMAYQISNMAATEFTHVISNVTFPAYAKIQDNKESLKKALTKTLKYTSLLSLPVAAGIFIIAPDFVKIYLGSDWIPMIPTLRIMCLFGAMRSVGAVFGPVYRALAKVNIPLKINLIHLIIMIILIYPLSVKYGINGTAITITISGLISLVLTSLKIKKLLSFKCTELFKFPFLSLIGCIIMMTIVYILNNLIANLSYISVIFTIFAGILSYLGSMYMIYRIFGYDLKDIWTDIVSGKRISR